VKRKGMFKNPILLQVIKEQWFADSKGEGPSFHVYFNPIPLPLIALVFSVVCILRIRYIIYALSYLVFRLRTALTSGKVGHGRL
jgi:hypothetical protein